MHCSGLVQKPQWLPWSSFRRGGMRSGGALAVMHNLYVSQRWHLSKKLFMAYSLLLVAQELLLVNIGKP